MSTELKIGQLARVANTSPPTIRYYEEIGLLPAPSRQQGSQRVYSESDIRRLTFVRRCRDLGFPIEQVRSLAALMDTDRPCAEARNLASVHLAEVRTKRRELEVLEESLSAFVDACQRACADGRSDECKMLEALAGPVPSAPEPASSCCGPAPEGPK